MGVFECVECKEDAPVTVSDLMVQTMVNWGVRHVFGMVGYSNLGLADAIRRRCENGELSFISVRHEGAASFAASAYGKISGMPAACLSIAGPGATNLLTGLWDAKMDRVPVLALTGQVDPQFLGPGAFQEIDLAAAYGGVACWSQTVLESSNHAELMNLALKNAIVRRDVAHLILPSPIQDIPVASTAKAGGPEGRLAALTISPPEESVDKAIRMIRASQQPAIIVGYGARSAMNAIVQLAEQLNIPVITTFKAKGFLSEHHPLSCGIAGKAGPPLAGWCMSQSDLLIVFGASFSRHTGILRDRPTIQVDLAPMALGRFHPVAAPVWGEIGVTANLFLQALAGATPKADLRADVAARWDAWHAKVKEREAMDRGKGLNSAIVCGAMNRHVPENAIITVDVGNNTYSFGRYFECSAQSIVMSGYLGAIGFAYPAALGAWAAAPERPVVAVAGDGGFAQYMAEVTTAVKYGMPIKLILLNNAELGKISEEQREEGKPVWSTSLVNPDFAGFAETCGALGIRVSHREHLDEAMERLIEHYGPAVVEVMTDSELN